MILLLEFIFIVSYCFQSVHLMPLIFCIFLAQIILSAIIFLLPTGGAAVPAAVLACNAANGVCMAACAAAVLTPTP